MNFKSNKVLDPYLGHKNKYKYGYIDILSISMTFALCPPLPQQGWWMVGEAAMCAHLST